MPPDPTGGDINMPNYLNSIQSNINQADNFSNQNRSFPYFTCLYSTALGGMFHV